MDSSLAQVIMGMQGEIRKLEKENRALRGELQRPPSSADQAEREPDINSGKQKEPAQPRDGAQDGSAHASLRRNASAPVLEGQYKENIIMTVRRYSITSNIQDGTCKSESLHKPGRDGEVPARGGSKWARLQEGAHLRPTSTISTTTRDGHSNAKDKLTNRHSLQEYVSKSRAKVKTVTFLLPVDDIYTNRPVLAGCQPDSSSRGLAVIAEKES